MSTDNRALWELAEKLRDMESRINNNAGYEDRDVLLKAAEILERPVVFGGWLPIESAPNDGTPHVRGLHVYAPDGQFLYWDIEAGHIDPEDGQFYDQGGEVSGWSSNDFTHWMPLAGAPETNESVVRGKS